MHIFDTFTTSQVSKQHGTLASQCLQPIFSLPGHALSELHLSRIRLTPIWYLLSCSQRSQAKNNNFLQVFSMLCFFSSISTHRRNSVLKNSQIFWMFNSSYVKDVRGKVRGFLWKKVTYNVQLLSNTRFKPSHCSQPQQSRLLSYNILSSQKIQT